MDLDAECWDACCLLNAIASGRAEAILRGRPRRACVVRQVLEAEVIKLRPLPEEDPTGTLISADDAVRALLDDNLLEIVDLSVDEQVDFVVLASVIDDGEARTIAIASSRSWSVVTDDSQARRLIRENYPKLTCVTTLDWLKDWSDSINDEETAADAIRRIELCARFKAPKGHPLRNWWIALQKVAEDARNSATD